MSDSEPESAAVRRIEAPIHDVTVFRNGALVVRRGSAPAGRLEVAGLPLLFNSDSLRVRAHSGTVRDLEETCSLEARPVPPPPSEAELRQMTLESQRLDDEIASIKALERLYENAGPQPAEKSSAHQPPDARAWMALHRFAGERLDALGERRRELELEKRRLGERRRKLAMADRGDREPPRFARGIRFALDETEAETVVEVEYFVPAARWVPSYTLELEGRDARLSLAALVAQATGEDWSGARLRFSTADLSRETTLPELRSWRIGRAQDQRRPAFRELPSDLESLFAGYDREAKKRPQPAPGPARPTAQAGFQPPEAEAELDDTAEVMVAELAAELGEPVVDLDATRAGGAPAAEAAPAPMKVAGTPRARKDRAPRMAQLQLEAVGVAAGSAPAMAAPPAAARRVAAPRPRPAPEPLPPRLRYAYLRLTGPDQPLRGTLRPIDPLEHLWSLVDDHSTAEIRDLRRAVDALRRAAKRLEQSPTPPGTTPLHDASYHHVYEAPGRHDVPSDGGYHRLGVERSETSVDVEYRAVPRSGDDVYRYCRLRSAAEAKPYPTGPLHVYDGGEFRVTTRLEGSGGGKVLELNLGVESALRIEGRVADVHQKETGVVAQKSKVEHRVRVRLRSALDEEARVVIYDRLPTPEDNQKDLEVKLTQSVPEAVEDGLGPDGKKLDGGLHWELRLAPGATGELSYTYEISLPAGSEIVGGNRRE